MGTELKVPSEAKKGWSDPRHSVEELLKVCTSFNIADITIISMISLSQPRELTTSNCLSQI